MKRTFLLFVLMTFGVLAWGNGEVSAFGFSAKDSLLLGRNLFVV